MIFDEKRATFSAALSYKRVPRDFFAMDSGGVWCNVQQKNCGGVWGNVQQKNSRTDVQAARQTTRGWSLR